MQDIDQLTVSQIMAEVGWTDRSSLARYLENEQTRMLLGASGNSRPTYPKAALPALAALYQAHQEHRCTPKTAPLLISAFLGTGPAMVLPDKTLSENRKFDLIGQREVVLPDNWFPIDNRFSPNGQGAPSAEIVRVMQEFIETVKDLVPVPEDCLLTRSQAAVLLACTPSSVSRFVKPLRRGAYRRSDCLRYIRAGVPIMNPIAPPSSVAAEPHAVAARVAVAKTEDELYAENEAENDKQRENRLSEIENWLKAKMITKVEADLLRRVEQPGIIDAKNLDKLMKIRSRVLAAERLAKNPNADDEARELNEKLREGVAKAMRENARIAAGL